MLALYRKWRLAPIRVGNRGTASFPYYGFGNHGSEIIAAFDSDGTKIRTRKKCVVNEDMESEKQVVRGEKIAQAIVAVAAQAAQVVIRKVVDFGISAMLIFARECQACQSRRIH